MTTLIDAAIAAGQPLTSLPQRKPKVFICTPNHSGRVAIDYHISMCQAMVLLHKHGVDYMLDYNVGSSIDYARSNMASMLLKETDCTHLLFIDDDMCFAPDLPVRLLMENVDIVAVPYRRKMREIQYNLRHDVRVKKIAGRPYMATVENIATGMMLIRRNVFEYLAPRVPEVLKDNKGDKMWLFFRHDLVTNDKYINGPAYMSEDYMFCQLVRQHGFDVWGYLDEPLAHIGPYAYESNYAAYIARDSDEPLTDGRQRQPLRTLLK